MALDRASQGGSDLLTSSLSAIERLVRFTKSN